MENSLYLDEVTTTDAETTCEQTIIYRTYSDTGGGTFTVGNYALLFMLMFSAFVTAGLVSNLLLRGKM